MVSSHRSSTRHHHTYRADKAYPARNSRINVLIIIERRIDLEMSETLHISEMNRQTNILIIGPYAVAIDGALSHLGPHGVKAQNQLSITPTEKVAGIESYRRGERGRL